MLTCCSYSLWFDRRAIMAIIPHYTGPPTKLMTPACLITCVQVQEISKQEKIQVNLRFCLELCDGNVKLKVWIRHKSVFAGPFRRTASADIAVHNHHLPPQHAPLITIFHTHHQLLLHAIQSTVPRNVTGQHKNLSCPSACSLTNRRDRAQAGTTKLINYTLVLCPISPSFYFYAMPNLQLIIL